MNEADLLRENRELRRKLADAEQTIGALMRGEVDAVAQAEGLASPVLLRAAQDRLRAQEQLLRAVFDGATDAILVVDDDRRTVDANPAACSLFGLSKSALVGRRVIDFAAPGYSPRASFDDLVTARVTRGEFPMVSADGVRRELEYSAVADVLPGLHLSVLRDVTERKASEQAVLQAEARLRASEARFRSMIEKSHDGISLIDANVRWIYTSPSVERLFGYTLDEAASISWQDIIPEDDLPMVQTALAQVLRSPSVPVTIEVRARRRDGEQRWLEVTATNLLDDPEVGAIVSNLRDVTERKLLERERDGFFRLALDLLAIIGFDGRVHRLNPTWETTLGWSIEELTSRPLQELVHPEDREATARMNEHLLRGEATERFENRYVCKNGGYRRLQWSALGSRDDGVIYATARDVTHEREAAERDRLLFAASPTPMWLRDDAFRILEVNDAAVQATGYSREELVGRSILDLVVDEDVAEVRRRTAEVLDAGSLRVYAWRLRTKDGEARDVEVTAHRLDVPGGRQILSVIFDVTERNAMERALRESERRYRRIVDNASEGIWMYDADGVTIFMNPRMAQMLRCTVEEATGKAIYDFMAAEALDETSARMNAGNSDARSGGEFRLKRRDGTDLWVSIQADPLLDEHGKFENALAILTDITEQRLAGDALRRSEERLRQAQKMEAVGNLAGGIAHDFNNLLSVVLSYCALILESLKASDPLRADLEEIQRAGVRATELTRQLLAFSRKQILQPAVVDVARVVMGTEKMLARLLTEDIQLSILASPFTGKVFADVGQLEQVIMNLVVNARDAMPQGGSLTVETSNVTLDSSYAASHPGVVAGAFVMLAVSDTGVGMDAATQARIFEPFFTTKDKSRGTGLGLSTVYGIIQQSGGHIWVYSEVGKGSTFKVYLPRTDRTVTEKTSVEPPATTLKGTETVLLVEDDASVRAIMRMTLRRNGYNVLEVENAGEAFLVCEQFGARIHLLLTDVVMPRMSGRQLAERLLALRPELKVLYVSGYTEDTIVHHGILDAGIDFLPKPITPEALLRKVRQVLDRSA